MIGAFGIIFAFPATLCLVLNNYLFSLIFGCLSLLCFIIKMNERKALGDIK